MNRTLFTILLVAFWSGFAAAQKTQPMELKLTGIIAVPGFRCALVVIDPSSHYSSQMILTEGERQHDVEMLQIDAAAGRVKVAVRLEPHILSLRTTAADPPASATVSAVTNATTNATSITAATNAITNVAPNTVTNATAIQLQEADLSLLLRLYGELKERTVLHPTLPTATFTLNAAATNRAQVASALAKAFGDQGLALIPDGKKFVQILPAERAATASPRAPRIKTPPPPVRDPLTGVLPPGKPVRSSRTIQPGEIFLPQVDLDIAVQVYGELVSRKLDESKPFPKAGGTISLFTQSALAKEEAIYAFDTLFAWEGIKMVPEGRDMIRAELIPGK